MRRKQLIALIGQLEMHASVGLPLSEAVRFFGNGLSENAKLKFARAANNIEAGKKFSAALSQEFQIPAMVKGLLDSGERSGILPDSLSSCRRFLEREDELVRRCLSAVAYPIVIGCTTVLLAVGLMEMVMPQVIPMLAGLHVQLPVLTRIVMFVSKTIAGYWWAIMTLLICLGIGATVLYRKFMPFKRTVHFVLMHTPLLGNLAYSYSLVAFFESLGSMLESGVPATDAFPRASEAIFLLPLHDAFISQIKPLIRGQPIHGLVSQACRTGPHVVSLLKAGEESGNLHTSLHRVAGMLDSDLDHALKHITALLEPAMMLGMGSLVGGIALSIMMPIYDISKAIQK